MMTLTSATQSDVRSHHDLVTLSPLMALVTGSPEIVIGIIDGPVAVEHPSPAGTKFQTIGDQTTSSALARAHGTFVAGILAAKRESPVRGICPGCTFLIRSVFEAEQSTTYANLARAISDCADAGARVLNISAAIVRSDKRGEPGLIDALRSAANRGVLIVSAAGNQSAVGGTIITACPGVIPVSACSNQGRPLSQSNFGISIGKRGFMAPGADVISLSAGGGTTSAGGTSAAAPFVTGAIGLLWSLFPRASSVRIKQALIDASKQKRNSVVPPLLNAWEAYSILKAGGV